MPADLACIVEGHGDALSVPVIARRIAHSMDVYDVRITPFRVPRYAVVRPGELERAVERAARSLGGEPRGIIVLLDADDDPAADLEHRLSERARAARPDQ